MMGSSLRAPDKEGVGSQDGCRAEGEGQRETGQNCQASLSPFKGHLQRNDSLYRYHARARTQESGVAKENTELQRRDGGRPEGRVSTARLTAAPIQQGAKLPPPSHRRAAWLFSIPGLTFRAPRSQAALSTSPSQTKGPGLERASLGQGVGEAYRQGTAPGPARPSFSSWFQKGSPHSI